MICNLTGTYKLTEDFKGSTSNTVSTLPKGSTFIVSQVALVSKKVWIEQLGDWVYWELPCEFVEPLSNS